MKAFSFSIFLMALITAKHAVAMDDFDFLPESSPISLVPGEPDLLFCSKWNPEFSAKGSACCPKSYDRRKRGRCISTRKRGAYCDERTSEQIDYEKKVNSGVISDVLEHLKFELSTSRVQSHCSVNTGFLAWGRPIVETTTNRIKIRTPNRCAHYGTDRMALLMEWLGREVAKMYPDNNAVKLLVADVSAPRGGCLGARTGGRGHSSHMAGLDVDIGFLTPVKPGREAPGEFHRNFDVQANWALIKKIFSNPFVCAKVVFLDRKLIKQLHKKVSSDPLWERYAPYIRHVKGHRDHLHIRIGNAAMLPGCLDTSPFDEEAESEELGVPETEDNTSGEVTDSIEPSPLPSYQP